MAIRVDNLEIRARWAGGQSVARGTRNVERDLDKVRTSTARVNAGLVSMGRLFGVAIGVETIRRVYVAALEMAKLAATVRTTEQAFDNLATKAGRNTAEELNRMREAVGGTLGDLELMQRVGGAVDAGLKFDQAITALEFLRRHSLAFGKDFSQLTRTVFTGLARGSVLFLDDAGIILSATDKMFDGMDDLEKKTALVAEAIRLMGVKMKDLPEIADSVVTTTGQVSAEWKKLQATIGKSLEGFFHERAQSDLAILKWINDTEDTRSDIEKSLRAEISELQALIDEANSRRVVMFNGRNLNRAPDGTEERLKVAKEYLDIIERTKESEAEENRLLQEALENGIRLDEERAKSKKRHLAANKEAFEQSIESNRLLIEDRDLRRLDAAEAAEFEEARADADAARFVNRQRVVDAITAVEVQATADQVKIQQYALFEQLRIDAARLRSLGATEEQLEKLAAAYRKLAQEVKDTAGEEDAARRKAEEEEIKRAEIRKILLVFEADASQVKNQADLAAFSLGLLTERIAGLSSSIGSAIRGIEQIATGSLSTDAKTGKITAAGRASIIAGGISLLITGLSVFTRRSAEAEREQRRLAEAMRAARDVAGELAREIENSTRGELLRQWASGIGELEVRAGKALPDFLKTIEGYNSAFAITQGFGGSQEAVVLATQLDRVAEALRFDAGTGIETFEQAMTQFNHLVRLDGVEDPTRKLEILRDSLTGIGVLIEDGLQEHERDALTGGQGRRLLETIADLQRDIQQAELDARQEQADALIQNIERNKIAILRAIDDAEKAQKQATLRAVGLQFDAREAGLRSQFFGQITGSRTDPLERERVLEDLQREIELLRVQEQAAAVSELERIRRSFDEARQAQEDQVTEQIRAVERATENLGVTFENALGLEIGGMTSTFDQVLSVTRMMQDTSNVQPVVTSVHQLSEDVTGAINTALDFGPVQVQMELIQRSTDALGADFGTWMTWSTDRIVNAVNNPTWAAAGGGTTVHFGNISLGNSGLSISDVRRMFQRELLPLIINEIIDGKLSARANPTFRSGGRTFDITGSLIPG